MSVKYTREEQIELVKLAQNGNIYARNNLVESYDGLLKKLARKYSFTSVGFMDLYQDGAISLMEAIYKFDPDRNIAFMTYAYKCVDKGMLDSITRTSRVVRLPDYMVHQIRRARNNNEKHEYEGAYKQASSLNVERHDDGDDWIDDLTSEVFIEYPDLERKLKLELAMDKFLDSLPEYEANIIRMRYGFGCGDAMTFEQIGEVLGVTKQAVHERYRKAMRIMRHRYARKLKEFQNN